MRARHVFRLFGEQNPSLGKVQQEGFVGLRLG